MNLNSYLELARRCVCLNVAPSCLPRVLTLFQENSGNLEHAYYWPKSSGLLLLQSHSPLALHKALRRIRSFPSSFLPILDNKGKTEKFILPPYRICSDPSIWPVASFSETFDENLVHFQPEPLTSGALEKILLQSDSVLGQMQTLVDRNSLRHPFRLALFTFSDALAEIVCSIRPGTTVYPFGSAINGLGSSSSDLDTIIELNLDMNPRLRIFAQRYPRAVTNFHQHPSTFGLSILQDLLGYNGQINYHSLTPIRFLLNRLDPLSAPSSRVLPGRTPIINYTRHKCLGVGVDISRSPGEHDSTHLVLHAAYWMRILVTQVPVFLYLASTLKYLMRGIHLTQYGPSFGFTNYKLSSLLVAFLQVATGQAPALEYLLLNNNEKIPEKLVIPLDDPTPCPIEAPQLLREFFVFLRALQPEKSTICLRSGRILSREGQVSQTGSLLHCPNPLMPEWNITHGIDLNVWKNFISALDHMEKALVNTQPDKSDKLWGLPAMTKNVAQARNRI